VRDRAAETLLAWEGKSASERSSSSREESIGAQAKDLGFRGGSNQKQELGGDDTAMVFLCTV
jgi:hypothetical protein